MIDPSRADWIKDALDPNQAKRQVVDAMRRAAEREHRISIPELMMFWSQKEAAKRYRQGGLAAVYPTVYGEGGIYAQAGADQPVDRWAPSRRVLNAQVKNGVLSKEDYEEAWPRAVGVGRRIRKFP